MTSHADAPGLESATTPSAPPLLLSGFWRRCLAFFLDGLIVGCAALAVATPFFDVLAQLGLWGRALGFLAALPYFAFLNSRVGGGQTLGKRVVGIRVANAEGECLSVGKSALRFSVMSLPFFLNQMPLAEPSLLIEALLIALIFGLGGAIAYLLIFNRRTRQSVHDLAIGSYVLRSAHEGRVVAGGVWRGHWIVLAVALLALVAVRVIVVPQLAESTMFVELTAVHSAASKAEGVRSATVQKYITGQKPYAVTAYWKRKPQDCEGAANEVARAVLAGPALPASEILNIQIVYGYDLRIASAWQSCSFSGAIEDWRKKLESQPKDVLRKSASSARWDLNGATSPTLRCGGDS